MNQVFVFVSSILLTGVLFTSCVSKKKYEELARAKRSSDREVINLQSDKTSLETEI